MADFSVLSYCDGDVSLPSRPSNSHKGTFGRVLCVCGSTGMCGAAYFAAKAAYRAGAGLVRILTTEENRSILQALIPEATLSVYDGHHPEPNVIDEAVAWADVLVVGCGLGTSLASKALVSHILRFAEKPLILDADALNLLAIHPALMTHARGAILTPHLGEMARLLGKSVAEIARDPPSVAYEFAKKTGTVCALKSHRTVISDGSPRLFVNASGNSGMATGGSGDVLAGLLGGLLAQEQNRHLPPLDLTALGVYLHGKCGELASERLTEFSVMASDLLDAIPSVLKQYPTKP